MRRPSGAAVAPPITAPARWMAIRIPTNTGGLCKPSLVIAYTTVSSKPRTANAQAHGIAEQQHLDRQRIAGAQRRICQPVPIPADDRGDLCVHRLQLTRGYMEEEFPASGDRLPFLRVVGAGVVELLQPGEIQLPRSIRLSPRAVPSDTEVSVGRDTKVSVDRLA